jgi:L-threonylcarbamoyladenylate synthase
MSGEQTNILPANGPNAIEWAVERLLEGGVIAFPTDTVYGLAASLAHHDQLERIYRIKGRDDAKPLPVLVASSEAAQDLTEGLTEEQRLLLDRYWPGPLTVVVNAAAHLPRRALAPDGTVGLRAPNHPLALEIIERAGGAIACTSANRSGEPAAITAEDVAAALGDDVDLILDGGAAPGGVSSTVVGFAGADLRLLREGPIPLEHVRAAWAELRAGRA